MPDVGRSNQGNAGVADAEILAQAGVGDMIGHPQRNLGDPRRKLVDFDPVELIDVETGQRGGVGPHAASHAGAKEALLDDFAFEFPKLAIGDHQEVASTARGVEEGQAGQLFLQPDERFFLARLEDADSLELGLQIVEDRGPITRRIASSGV